MRSCLLDIVGSVDKSLREAERAYASNPCKETFELLTRIRERNGLLDAFAMVNGFGYFVPSWIKSRQDLQPFIDFELKDSDHIDLHFDGYVKYID